MKIFFIILLLAVVGTIISIFLTNKDRSTESGTQEVQTEAKSSEKLEEESVDTPRFLERSFSKTDFSQANKKIEKALSGGPGKDGIPALTNPVFEPISDTDIQDPVQAIVLIVREEVRAYPYNILAWHEIVNDEIDDASVAVTFCPLCGSAIVFDRRVGDSTLEFGVSGALIDSNMIMYDRETESLWQQSTGVGLAGQHFNSKLEIFPMQLMTVGEIKQKYPTAKILSEDTGHRRNYDRNPYSGYDEDDELLFFPVGDFGSTHDAKEIMVVFRINGKPAAIPLEKLEEEQLIKDIHGASITLSKTDGEVEVVDDEGKIIPFYFEMWFSFSAQHGKDALVL